MDNEMPTRDFFFFFFSIHIFSNKLIKIKLNNDQIIINIYLKIENEFLKTF